MNFGFLMNCARRAQAIHKIINSPIIATGDKVTDRMIGVNINAMSHSTAGNPVNPFGAYRFLNKLLKGRNKQITRVSKVEEPTLPETKASLAAL